MPKMCERCLLIIRLDAQKQETRWEVVVRMVERRCAWWEMKCAWWEAVVVDGKQCQWLMMKMDDDDVWWRRKTNDGRRDDQKGWDDFWEMDWEEGGRVVEVGEIAAFIVYHQNWTAPAAKLHFEPSLWHPTHWRKMLPIGHLVVMYIAIEVFFYINSMSPVPNQCPPLEFCCLLV